MLCYLYHDMAYVMSDYSYTFNVMLLVQIYGVRDVRHVRTSGDGTLDMALESGLLIGASPLKIAGG